MDRKIKFRGKSEEESNRGEWVYGGFAIVESRPTIFKNIVCYNDKD